MPGAARCFQSHYPSATARIDVIFVVIALLLSARAATYGTPPPPLWIAGWYDGDNFDDAAEAFTQIKSLTAKEPVLRPDEPAPLCRPDLLPAACLAPRATVLPPGPAFRLPRLRAPPLS